MNGEKHPHIIRAVADLRRIVDRWRDDGQAVALVPTMGALHEGHFALVRAAQAAAARTIVSIFVNPTQFAPGEDFETYPRTMDDDLQALADLEHPVHAVFAPPASAMYPDGFATTVHVTGPADGLESDHRPHFFDGVATVVAKLLLCAQPDAAYFGEKDYQQLLVVRRMTADLNIATEIVSVPTIREADGLALSSRNRRLSDAERAKAPLIYAAMRQAAETIRHGGELTEAVRKAEVTLAQAGFQVDYFEIRDAQTLRAPSVNSAALRILVAARMGQVRLIDNLPVDAPPPS